MNLQDIDRQIAELKAQREAITRGGILRPIDDETLQILGLIAADAARAGRIVPLVPVYCDTGETARLFRDRAKILPGDRLVAVPPMDRFRIFCDHRYRSILQAWGCKIECEPDGILGVK